METERMEALVHQMEDLVDRMEALVYTEAQRTRARRRVRLDRVALPSEQFNRLLNVLRVIIARPENEGSRGIPSVQVAVAWNPADPRKAAALIGRLLRPYGLSPVGMRINGRVVKAFRCEDIHSLLRMHDLSPIEPGNRPVTDDCVHETVTSVRLFGDLQ